MKFILTEQQYDWKVYHEKFEKNYDNIFNELMSHPDFVEDLKNHSYNKENYVHWWKSAKEDFFDLASKKYCGLFKEILFKYELWEKIFKLSDYGFSNQAQNNELLCLRHVQWVMNRYFDWLRGYPYEGDDGPIINRAYYGVPDISEYFMEVFYNKTPN